MTPGSDGDATTASDGRNDDQPAGTIVTEPSDAFQALGNEIRMGILETMLARTDADGPSRPTFTDLFEASGLETSAKFAYHLEQLEGAYLRKVEGDGTDSDGYEFTYAGRKIARAIAAGDYTRRVDRDPISLSDPCPFCDAAGLEATSTDNVVTVACRECDRSLLGLDFPPSGLEAHGERLPEAFDRHHRHRLALMQDGVCPECSGRIDGHLVSPTEGVKDLLPEPMTGHLQAAFECHQCGHGVRCPVTLALLEHPAVVSFHRDHDRPIRDRPIWNVGDEWHETVLSEDPLCVRVVVELEEEILALYVDGTVQIREIQRTDTAPSKPEERPDAALVSSERMAGDSSAESLTATPATTEGADGSTDAQSRPAE
ncbi:MULTISPECIES: DUF7351 domain-containing protein [Natrialbaceae]|uniref:DUF7351 domain-containing protein n=1 Tax=Natrialbaceae TaxID=1644061 RepID=UPI00207C69AE|nr:ArsR family transcriptional regulator [Natronococcus sp. CG52]